jgi:hypothetical protein
MASTQTNSPFMGSVTATTAAQDLFTLLSAVFPKLTNKAQVVRIQLDPGSGSTVLYIGNNVTGNALAPTMCGVAINAGQVLDMPSASSNLYVLSEIFILASTGTAQVNLTVLTR